MGRGSYIYPGDKNNAVNKVNAALRKWGVGGSASHTASGNTITAWEVNDLLGHLRNIKNKCGWTGAIPANVSVGQHITPIFATIGNIADIMHNLVNTKFVSTHNFVYNWTGRGVTRSGHAGGNPFGRADRRTGTGPINVLSVGGISGAFKIAINFNANFYNVSIWDSSSCSRDQPSCLALRADNRSLLESTPMPMLHNPYGFGLANGAPSAPAWVSESTAVNQTGRFNYSNNIHNLGIGVWYTIANAAAIWSSGDIPGNTGPLIGCSDGFDVYSIIEVCRTNHNTILIRYDHSGSQNPAASGSYTSYSKGWTYSSVGVWHESNPTYSLPRSQDGSEEW